MEYPHVVDLPIPGSLTRLCQSDSGRVWLESLPKTVEACRAKWNLTLGEPFASSSVSLVLPVATATDEDLVLKVQFPNSESDFEGEALRIWAGNGAVRLIEEDAKLNALLLERCLPGHHLSTMDAQTALAVLTGLLPRIWVPASEPFQTLADEVELWVKNLPTAFHEAGSPFERYLLDGATKSLTELASSQGDQVLVNQDLHGDNVISAEREPWLVIDPKPLVGEREFGLSPIIRSYEFGHSKDEVLHRLDRLSDELGLDRERARLWAFGHAVAWGFEGDQVLSKHIDTAGWLLKSR